MAGLSRISGPLSGRFQSGRRPGRTTFPVKFTFKLFCTSRDTIIRNLSAETPRLLYKGKEETNLARAGMSLLKDRPRQSWRHRPVIGLRAKLDVHQQFSPADQILVPAASSACSRRTGKSPQTSSGSYFKIRGPVVALPDRFGPDFCRGNAKTEIVDFGGLGGPGRPGYLPKRWGTSPPHLFGRFPGRPAAQTPKIDDFRSVQKLYIRNPAVSLRNQRPSLHKGPQKWQVELGTRPGRLGNPPRRPRPARCAPKFSHADQILVPAASCVSSRHTGKSLRGRTLAD